MIFHHQNNINEIKTHDEEELYLSINSCFFLVLLNLQVSMSLDRVYAICFPMLYMVKKNNSYKIIMIVLAFVIGLLGGSAYLVYYDFGHSDEYKSENIFEIRLNYSRFYSLWTVASVIVIIICNGFILYSMRARVRR
jgi:7 transmembrane receptor (rhodopsin family)